MRAPQPVAGLHTCVVPSRRLTGRALYGLAKGQGGACHLLTCSFLARWDTNRLKSPNSEEPFVKFVWRPESYAGPQALTAPRIRMLALYARLTHQGEHLSAPL
jgi:hypothetical protein